MCAPRLKHPAALIAGEGSMGPALQRAMALLGRQRWLDPFAERAQRSIVGAFKARGEAGQRVKNALHGVWLGHPLHQAITDVPVGAWTTAAVLDLLDTAGGDRFARGADAAIVVGLAGATGAAVSGLTDWSATDGAARRQGIVHGALNGLVSLLYIASLLRRLAGDRAGGRRTAFTAYGIASVSAYIGGHLVAGERVGVDHAPALPEVSDYRPVLAASELAEGQPRRVELDGMPLMLVRRGPRV